MSLERKESRRGVIKLELSFSFFSFSLLSLLDISLSGDFSYQIVQLGYHTLAHRFVGLAIMKMGGMSKEKRNPANLSENANYLIQKQTVPVYLNLANYQ